VIPESPLHNTGTQDFARAGATVGQKSAGGKRIQRTEVLSVHGTGLIRKAWYLVRTLIWTVWWSSLRWRWWAGVWEAIGTVFLRSWVDNTWGANITRPPSIRLLAKGWFAFLFSAREDVSWVLSKIWSMVGTPIVLKRWTPNFDAKRERVDVVPIWVRLSGLPMQYWNSVHFAAIGNKLGTILKRICLLRRLV
jgi:hypothetical protein